jgi:hypothetical protein
MHMQRGALRMLCQRPKYSGRNLSVISPMYQAASSMKNEKMKNIPKSPGVSPEWCTIDNRSVPQRHIQPIGEDLKDSFEDPQGPRLSTYGVSTCERDLIIETTYQLRTYRLPSGRRDSVAGSARRMCGASRRLAVRVIHPNAEGRVIGLRYYIITWYYINYSFISSRPRQGRVPSV